MYFCDIYVIIIKISGTVGKIDGQYITEISKKIIKEFGAGLNHEKIKKSLLIIEAKWLTDFFYLKICFFLCNK